MQVRFFMNEDGTLDERAIKGGVYHIELLKENNDKRISLYIGESAHMVARGGEHLYKSFNSPTYLGLKEEDVKDDSLILEFSILDSIDEIKPIKEKSDNPYHEAELERIRNINPLTQLTTSDRQKEESKRVEDVQNEMIKYKFK